MDIEEKISDLERQLSELSLASKQQEQAWQIVCDSQLMLNKLGREQNEEVIKNTTEATKNSEIMRNAAADLEDLRKSVIVRIERLESAFEEWRKPVMERLEGLEASIGIGKVSKVSPLS